MLDDMKHIIAASLLLLAVPALSQDISGVARAADGDSLDFGGIAVRLHGIDAPELSQTCERPDGNWPCGKAAAAKLAALVGRQQIICEQHDIDAHGRTVAACRAGATDLAGAMVDAGLAVALAGFSDRYVAHEARAKAARLGLWAGTFQMPADYRAAHPRTVPRNAHRHREPIPSPPPRAGPSTTYYSNCKEAWASGAAPLHRGQPGYRPEMDGDGDGIACEPYRRR
jgi:endonuclease YncB( thermonuclease family)